MIIQSPLRLSLMGGGSDLRYFYKSNNAASIGFPINRYCYVNVSDYQFHGINLTTEKENFHVSNPRNISNPLLREILSKFKIKNKKINIFNDIPYGTGLGSSSSLTVCLTKAFNILKHNKLSNVNLAEMSFLIEEKVSGSTIGKQDHFMSTFGGINKFTYNQNKTIVKKLKFDRKSIQEIEEKILLIKVGPQRKAYDLLYDQKNNILSDIKKKNSMSELVSLVPLVEKALSNFEFKDLGSYLKKSWELKKTLSSKITNTAVDDLYHYLCDLGIYGGKLLGAGGSGYFMVISNSSVKKKIFDKISNDKIIDIKIDSDGCKVIRNG